MPHLSRVESAPTVKIPRPAAGDNLELELLFLCARMVLDSRTHEKVRALLEAEIDWDFLIRTAHQHRVLPLLYRTLVQTFPNYVSKSAMERLRTAFQANAKRNLLLTGELLRIIDLLAAHGIRSISYKGPALAAAIYGNISLRQFSDLDIIVPVSDAERAWSLMMSLGYKPPKVMSPKEWAALTKKEKDLTLLRDDAGINLELHWRITNEKDPIQVDPQYLWKNLNTVSIAGKTVQIHAAEDLLLILCIHGGKHRWEHLGWLCDIAEIIRSHEGLDWAQVIEQASKLGGRRILFLGLLLARDILGAEVPANVVRVIETDRKLNKLSEQLKQWIRSETPVPLGETERYLMRLKERRTERFRIAAAQVKKYFALTSRDTEALPVPGFLLWVLYIVRPFRLAREYGLRPLKRFLNGMFGS